MTKHTPGPWRSRSWGKTISINSVEVSGIAFINPGEDTSGIPSPQSRADARLIESSPDLLNSLQRLTTSISEALALRSSGLAIPEKVWRQIETDNLSARIVINKAETK